MILVIPVYAANVMAVAVGDATAVGIARTKMKMTVVDVLSFEKQPVLFLPLRCNILQMGVGQM